MKNINEKVMESFSKIIGKLSLNPPGHVSAQVEKGLNTKSEIQIMETPEGDLRPFSHGKDGFAVKEENLRLNFYPAFKTYVLSHDICLEHINSGGIDGFLEPIACRFIEVFNHDLSKFKDSNPSLSHGVSPFFGLEKLFTTDCLVETGNKILIRVCGFLDRDKIQQIRIDCIYLPLKEILHLEEKVA